MSTTNGQFLPAGYPIHVVFTHNDRETRGVVIGWLCGSDGALYPIVATTDNSNRSRFDQEQAPSEVLSLDEGEWRIAAVS